MPVPRKSAAPPKAAPAAHPPRTARIQKSDKADRADKSEPRTCLKPAVEIAGAGETATLSRTKCDGSAVAVAVDQLSILARPGSAPKPKVTIEALGKAHGREVAPGIRRIVANNPGPYTFLGTNTYVVGNGQVAIIDPGPADERHLKAIAAATRGERLTHILVTHSHHDHCDSARALQTLLGGEIGAFGPTGTPRGAGAPGLGDSLFAPAFAPDRRLGDGDAIKGKDFALDVLHMPGHSPDHLCFALVGKRIVFTGGSGKAGWACVQDLIAHGYQVFNVDNVVPANDVCPFIVADLSDFGQTLDARSSMDTGIHGKTALIEKARRLLGYEPQRSWRDPASRSH